MKIKTKIIGVLSALLLLSNFAAYAVSKGGSTLFPQSQVAHVSDEDALIVVQLRDSKGRPLEDHKVKLFSNFENLTMVAGTGLSNEIGEVEFKVNSKKTGLVRYVAYDLTADVILDQAAKVLYFENSDELFSTKDLVLNNYEDEITYAATIITPASKADALKFEDLPAVIKANEPATFTVSAYDVANQLVPDYKGKVRFSVSGQNSKFADLPGDYQFKVEDQGTHIFSLAFKFDQPGVYKMKVTDLDNQFVYGETDISVSVASASTASNKKILISSPLSGTFSNGVQVINGRAPANSTVKIFDNAKEIGSIVAAANGEFTFTTNSLADGQHKIYAAIVNDGGTIVENSEVINLMIDTTSAEISKVTLEPAGAVDPGTQLTLKMYSNENIAQAQVVVNANIYSLTKSKNGYYQTVFKAPLDFGTYDLKFSVVDELGNESTFESDVKVQVGAFSDNSKPERVTGLKLETDDHKVILKWSAPVNSANIHHFRVYYGTAPNNLNQAVDTFTNATTWYIPNLNNGQEYFFAVAAVDNSKNIGEQLSEILNATPGVKAGVAVVKEVVSPTIEKGVEGNEILGEMKDDVSKTGPEIFWLISLSAIGGVCYSSKKKQL
ncbi:MAG: Ig-like domain-containing protein [Patescibacteria group bacterium]